METPTVNGWPLVRFFVPAFPEINIFSRISDQTTPLGLVSVATAANKVWGWRVEVVDENNYRGPRDDRGLPDHRKLQEEDPASVVGFYCGLTSTMERVFELAEFYRGLGVFNVAGGWHAHYCPEEVLGKHIDVVVHGDGEIAIQQILSALKDGRDVCDIPGISVMRGGSMVTNSPEMLQLENLSDLPYPDFGLLRHVKKMKLYPIGRVRGCAMNCEFCSVKGKPRWASPRFVFGVVNSLVEKWGAKKFFIVDDRLEENLEGITEFFRLVSEKYQDRLFFTVQIRLETAKNPEFLEVMKKAGVRIVCVGYESPIDEDLFAMRKGYNSRHMVEWTKILRRYFWVHGMFIFGYPSKKKTAPIGVAEVVKRFKKFIREAKISSIQVLHPVPIVGTDLRKRLMEENRIFPLEIASWDHYDGNYAIFQPDNMTLRELQEKPLEIMWWFYSSLSLLKIPFRTAAFPVDYLIRGWRHWYRGLVIEVVRYSGHRLLKRWHDRQKKEPFLERLEKYEKENKPG